MDQFVLRQSTPGEVVLTCRGDLDLLSRAELGAACYDALEPAPRRLVVDLDEVAFLDCGSVRLLALTATLQTSQGGEFLVVCANDFQRRVLRLTGFSTHHTVVAAIAELPGVPLDVPATARSESQTRLSSPVPARPSVRRAAR